MSDSPSTSFVLTCPGCQKRFLLKNNATFGKRANCKSCGAGFMVDGSVLVECESKDIPPFKQKPWPERTEFEIPSVSLLPASDDAPAAVIERESVKEIPKELRIEFENWRTSRAAWKEILAWFVPLIIIGIALAMLGLSLELQKDRSGQHFPFRWGAAIVFYIGLPMYFCYVSGSSRKTTTLVAALTLLLCIWSIVYSARTDTYLDVRSLESGGTVTDTYSSWSQTPLKRTVSLETGSISGPLSNSGKMHGEWTNFVWKPKFKTETLWYWYGEQVTEGEWHLRNK